MWLLDNDKPKERKGKVQLINAASFFQKLRKNVGEKKNELSAQNITDILRLYDDFEQNEYSKIFEFKDFSYTTVTVEQPLRLNWAFDLDRIETALEAKVLGKLDEDQKKTLRNILIEESKKDSSNLIDVELVQSRIREACVSLNLSPSQLKAIASGLAMRDPDAPIQKDSKGKQMPDAELRDTENIPFYRDINEYMDKEVSPFISDFWLDRSKDKIGYEIPFNRHFYEYAVPRSIETIDKELNALIKEISLLLKDAEQ